MREAMPAVLSPVGGDLQLVCPACRRGLRAEGETLRCSSCRRRYPVVAGIPDLRLRPDRYLSLDGDRAKARELAALDELSFPDLVAEYWRRTPEVPPRLAARYAENAVDSARRGGAYLDGLPCSLAGRFLLDVGCGTGGMVLAAARRGARPVGVDIALRWLVIARRQLAGAGVDAPLIAADGAMLPFRAATFDVTTCIETLEHAADQRGLLYACLSSTRPEGRVLVVTANRYSVAPEPNVRLWLVGYLPRRWMPGYVRRRRGTRYEFFRAVSAGELRAMIGPRTDVRVEPGHLPPPPLDASRVRLRVHAAYERAASSRLIGRLLRGVSPFLAVTGQVGAE